MSPKSCSSAKKYVVWVKVSEHGNAKLIIVEASTSQEAENVASKHPHVEHVESARMVPIWMLCKSSAEIRKWAQEAK
jgi:hypothetical protein